MKIFQIGFNKCGTKSLYHFFKKNGHKSIHWDQGIWEKTFSENLQNNKKFCEGYDDIVFWSDINYLQIHFEAFAIQYPNSKFIYNFRPIDDWIESRKKHYKNKKSLEQKFIKPYKLNERNTNVIDFWRNQYIMFEYRINHFFSGEMKKRLLFFNLYKDNGETISSFFNELKFNDISFPHLHKSK